MRRGGAALTAFATAPILLMANSLKNAARDAQETNSKFKTVFKGISKGAENAALNLSKNFGLAGSTSKQLLGDTGDLLTGFGSVTDFNLHCSNGGSCVTTFLDIPDTSKGAISLLTVKLVAFCIPFDALVVNGFAILLPNINSAGLNTVLSIVFAPRLALVFTKGANPYLYPSCVNLPTIGKPPPTNVPSAPYLILFLNSAPAFFLPVSPSVDSGSTSPVATAAHQALIVPGRCAVWSVPAG